MWRGDPFWQLGMGKRAQPGPRCVVDDAHSHSCRVSRQQGDQHDASEQHVGGGLVGGTFFALGEVSLTATNIGVFTKIDDTVGCANGPLSVMADWLHRYNHDGPDESLGRVLPIAYGKKNSPAAISDWPRSSMALQMCSIGLLLSRSQVGIGRVDDVQSNVG